MSENGVYSTSDSWWPYIGGYGIFRQTRIWLEQHIYIIRPKRMSSFLPRRLVEQVGALAAKVGWGRPSIPEATTLWGTSRQKCDGKDQLGEGQARHLVVSWGVPPNQPFLDGISHEINHPAIGYPLMETPISSPVLQQFCWLNLNSRDTATASQKATLDCQSHLDVSRLLKGENESKPFLWNGILILVGGWATPLKNIRVRQLGW